MAVKFFNMICKAIIPINQASFTRSQFGDLIITSSNTCLRMKILSVLIPRVQPELFGPLSQKNLLLFQNMNQFIFCFFVFLNRCCISKLSLLLHLCFTLLNTRSRLTRNLFSPRVQRFPTLPNFVWKSTLIPSSQLFITSCLHIDSINQAFLNLNFLCITNFSLISGTNMIGL